MDEQPIGHGMALQIQVGDIGAGRVFYTKLFGREPDFAPHDDFLEWQVVRGAECWWQIVGSVGEPRPLRTRLRFLVDDVRATARWLTEELDVQPSTVESLPGVVAYLNFTDPWGNQLGCYEDLANSGEPTGPGGSVHDESHFRRDPD